MQTSRTLEARTLSVASVYMRHVYAWMTAGLGVTSVVALAVASSPSIQQMIFGNMLVMIALILAQFGIVIALSAAVHKMSATTATGMFLLYSVLTGLTLSSIFVVYPIGSIANAFITAAGMFLAMSVILIYVNGGLISTSFLMSILSVAVYFYQCMDLIRAVYSPEVH